MIVFAIVLEQYMTNSILSKISSNYHFKINESLGTKKNQTHNYEDITVN